MHWHRRVAGRAHPRRLELSTVATGGYSKGGSGTSIRAPKGQGLEELRASLSILADVEVLVGVPEETTDVRNEDGQEYITNAALAYIHDNGEPSANIPARPFMVPGITAVQEKIAGQLRKVATRGLTDPDTVAVEAAMHSRGPHGPDVHPEDDPRGHSTPARGRYAPSPRT
jgi:hypothetical protein